MTVEALIADDIPAGDWWRLQAESLLQLFLDVQACDGTHLHPLWCEYFACKYPGQIELQLLAPGLPNGRRAQHYLLTEITAWLKVIADYTEAVRARVEPFLEALDCYWRGEGDAAELRRVALACLETFTRADECGSAVMPNGG